MESAHIFRILTLCLAALAVEADPTIRIEVNNTSVQPGETMQFTCVAANLKGGTSFLRIQKDVIGTDTPVDTLVLATNTILSKNLDAIDRYMIAFAQGVNSDELRFTFTITDAEHVDSGVYGCSIMGSEGVIVADSKEITVVNVVDFLLEMTVTRADGEVATYSSGDDTIQTYELDEHETFHVAVRTSYTHPAPTVAVMVGNQNVDDQLEQTVTTQMYQDDSGLLTGVRSMVAVEGDIMVDHSYKSGFKVVATANGKEETVSFNVKFSGYPPIIDETCTQSIMAGNHQKEVNFECSVTSDEPVDVYFYYFRELAGEIKKEREIITPGSQDANEDYHYEASIYEDRDNGKVDVVLHMPLVYPQMFTEYTLFASNSKGNATHKFTLEEDPSKSPVDANHASQLSVTITTVLMLAMATTLSQLL